MTTKTSFNRKAPRKTLDPDIAQRKASDPAVSVWLTANAGTGKTKVLTDRVLRLLLDGNAPEDILCVTFTTAAAALMQKRIRRELSAWTTCTDTVLDRQLEKLVGKKPDAAMRNHARQLFARFLEAPEGIKIQTIHSLSQTLIQKFPIESKVPPSFKVMDEEDSFSLLRDAQADILNAVQDNPDSNLAMAVRMITPEVAETEFISLVKNIVTNRKTFRKMIAEHGGLSQTIEAVYDYLETEAGVTGGDLRFMMGDEQFGLFGGSPDVKALGAAADVLMQGSKTDRARGEMLSLWLASSVEERNLMFKEYLKLFLTDKDEVRKTLATKQAGDALPALQDEADRLLWVLEEIKTANVARGTEALLILGNAVLDSYEKRKTALNYLDYDDLIHKASTLLADKKRADWVLRKMPGRLRHVLVDEAQDTSPEQWQIVESFMGALFREKTATRARTLFVVGDEKQSIFSFQGADPVEFARRKAFFEKLVKKSGGKWRNVNMDITFRSSQAILDAVDAVFKREEAAKGVKFDEKKAIRHKSFRTGQAGVVEVNPPRIGTRQKDEIESWSIPMDMEGVSNAALELAEEIAERIKGWLDSGEVLEGRGRPISPNDIMILVRRRSAFVDHVVRALKKRDVPVTGVDRMVLSEQIAVKDLLALGEFLLNPSDDYKLAVILKSPVIGMTDKQLETLALGREGSLWDALKKKSKSRAKANAPYKKAYQYLNGLSDQLKTKGTYKFYSNVLMRACPASEKSGLSAIYKRLGNEAEDPMVEFLNALERFEKDHPPSLQAFISWLEAGEAEIKREINLDSNEPRVSIMTVHGAKGLEAPIVILPDTTGVPADNIQARPRLLWPEGARKVPLWAPSTALENQAFKREKDIIEQARDNEYKRLLYVAMTRAADRLYVYGHQNRDSLRDLSWHKLISAGMEEHLGRKIARVALPVENEGDTPKEKLVYSRAQTAAPVPDGIARHERQKKTALPDWARVAPKAEARQHEKFTPSKAGQQKAGNDNKPALPSPLFESRKTFDVFKRGTATHNLLEFLPRLSPDKRQNAAQKFLARSDLGFSPKQQHDIWQQTRAVIEHPDYRFMFGKDSRAEVNIAGTVKVAGEKRQLNGQIDRLAIDGDDVWIIDYKSNARIPEGLADTPALYMAQMAAYQHVLRDIYPGKNIRCALLWTRKPVLQELPQAALDAAAKKMKLGMDAPVQNVLPVKQAAKIKR